MRTLVARENVGISRESLEVSEWVSSHSAASTSVAKLVKLAIASVTPVSKMYSEKADWAPLSCSMLAVAQ